MFSNSESVKWLRDRSTKQIIAKSLNDYYLNNCTASNEENINFIKRNEITDNLKHELKHLSCKIKPEYIFSQTKLNEVRNLKDIFLEFDRDKSSTTLLNNNKI